MTFTMRRAVVVLAVALGAVVPVTAAHAETCTPTKFGVTAAQPELYEGDTAGTVGFQLTASVPQGCTTSGAVVYRTQSGTATAGQDFEFVEGTWQPGGGVGTSVSVPVVPDVGPEEDESFSLALYTTRGAFLGAATATLLDDDGKVAPPMAISVSGGKICWVPESCKIPLQLSTPARAAFVVRYRTLDVTAVAGLDYVPAKDLKLTVPKGATAVDVQVQTLPDVEVEGEETFALEVFATSAGTVGNPVEKVAIRPES
ncbi:Calx-beta domain-containing protein [Saccharothrix variisporea]|uniref:Calx-beta domain-containing protein n=1 Tax=Saccharothrix variisporea TaxID=543527 RepID=A0A495X625_9PSEU|nr:Calx-beta domain-containing protein [Saccharothrix variisporea]RKT68979.1 Calx-beta domain-containing protein [Saccharothrix variisporea]